MIQNLASTSIFPTNFLGNQTANQERERYEAGAGTIARVWVKKKNLREVKIRPAVRGREIGPAMLESE